tara:strand:- start:479 stop:688 length:210 start_codon:yes stop_codon:yes gene_type:complete
MIARRSLRAISSLSKFLNTQRVENTVTKNFASPLSTVTAVKATGFLNKTATYVNITASNQPSRQQISLT